MPVAVMSPNMPEKEDPLDKLAKALTIAKAGFGIAADMSTLDSERARKKEEDKLRGLQTRKLEQELDASTDENDPQSPLMGAIREAAQKRGLTLPEGTTPKQARTNFDAFLKPKEVKEKDPLAQALAQERLDAAREKRAAGPKRDKEWTGRFKNINTQLDALDKMIDDKGTFELFGGHEKKLQQAIDAVAIDSAKLFDPESVARESEVAAFRNMLFQPGTMTTKNSTARDILTNYKDIIKSRAENEGLAHLIQKEQSPLNPGDGLGLSAGDGAPPKPKVVKQNGVEYTLQPDGSYK
jgi:hypothetical protein